MGFKDLHLFNDTLLAKQAWRVIKHPHSLWVHIMKGIYFPFYAFMDAPVDRQASWGWRSLLVGREAIRLGYRWNILGPYFLNVWNDAWIPALPNFRIQSQRPEGSPIIYIIDLIDPVTNQWDPILLANFFFHDEGKAILSIPLAVSARDLEVVWHHSRCAQVSVKSVCYQLKKRDIVERAASSSQSVRNFSFWTDL